MNFRGIISLLLLSCPALANAALLSYEFSGVISFVSDSGDRLSGVSNGTEFHGSVTYETAVYESYDETANSKGWMTVNTEIKLSIGDAYYVHHTDIIENVFDDWNDIDRFALIGAQSISGVNSTLIESDLPDPIHNQRFGLRFSDPNMSLIDGLSDIPTDLTTFQTVDLHVNGEYNYFPYGPIDDSAYSMGGYVTSITAVPLPPAFYLFGTALAGLIGYRKNL